MSALLYPEKSSSIAGPWGFDYANEKDSPDWQIEEIDRATFLKWAYAVKGRHLVSQAVSATSTTTNNIDFVLSYGAPYDHVPVDHVLSCVASGERIQLVHCASLSIHRFSFPGFHWWSDPDLPESTFYFVQDFFMERVILNGEEKFFVAVPRYPEQESFVSASVTASEDSVEITHEFSGESGSSTWTNVYTINSTHFD